MQKVLMIAPTPFFADRGCHTQIYEEIKALQKLGYDITLCTYGLGRDVPDVKIVRCMNFFWYKKLSAGPSLTKILLLPVLTLLVLKTILHLKPNIVHAHLHEGACIARVCSIFFRSKKYVFDMQGSLTGELLQHGFVSQGNMGYRFFAMLEKIIAGWFPVITQSDSMIQELRVLRGEHFNNAYNVKDGVDTMMFKPTPFNKDLAQELGVKKSAKRVLFMGLLEEYQGVDLMFDAFSSVAKRIDDVQFIVIGYPNVEKYSLICDKMNIKNKVLFLGRIDYQQLPQYLSLAKIAVAPKIALTEGDGKIYNYMAMGMTTIAFERSVSREILGDAGIYCEMGNADAMSEAIAYAINSPEKCRQIGDSARKRAVDRLSWDAVAKRIETVYNEECDETR